MKFHEVYNTPDPSSKDQISRKELLGWGGSLVEPSVGCNGNLSGAPTLVTTRESVKSSDKYIVLPNWT